MLNLFSYMLYLIYGLLVILIGYVVLNIFRQDRKFGSTLICPDCDTAELRLGIIGFFVPWA